MSSVVNRLSVISALYQRADRSRTVSTTAMATSIPPVPASFKPLQHHFKTAAEHDSRDPVVAYYCKYTFFVSMFTQGVKYSIEASSSINTGVETTRGGLMPN